MKKIKLYIFHEFWTDHGGGGETYLFNLVKGLLSYRNLNIKLIGLICTKSGYYNYSLRELKSLNAENLSVEEVDISAYSQIRNPFEILSAITSVISFKGVDVVHHTDGGAWGIIAGKSVNSSIRSLVSYHHVLPKAWTYFSVRKNRALALLANRVVAVSKKVSQCITAEYLLDNAKAKVIYNGIDPSIDYHPSELLKERCGIPEGKFVVGYIGRLEEEKNLMFFLQTLKEKPDCWIVIIGEGSQRLELEKYCNDNDLNNISFIGFKPDARKWIRMFNVLCLPSLSEAFGFVLIEGMVASIPVIGSNVDGIKEVLADGKYGLMFDPTSSVELLDKINQVQQGRDASLRIATEAKKFALKEFGVDRMITSTVSLYFDVLKDDMHKIKEENKILCELVDIECERYIININKSLKLRYSLSKFKMIFCNLSWKLKLYWSLFVAY